MNLKRRVEALESKCSFESQLVVLHMPDGRTETLRGGEHCVYELLSCVLRGDRTPQVELLGQSISSREPGSGHMLDLARAILNSPE